MENKLNLELILSPARWCWTNSEVLYAIHRLNEMLNHLDDLPEAYRLFVYNLRLERERFIKMARTRKLSYASN